VQINHQKEQQRLTALYTTKSDAELTELAQDQKNLTEDALSVLESEFLRRDLQFERQNLPAIAHEEDVKLVALRRFRDLPGALVAKRPARLRQH